MKTAIAALALVMLVGCSSRVEYEWELDYRPVTQEEREALDDHVKAIMCTTKRDLNMGDDDQDLEDYVSAVYYGATRAICKPRLFERRIESGWGDYKANYTGRYRDLTETKEN